MYTDMTVVTIKSNKIVLNEVKDISATGAILQKKTQMNFLANIIVSHRGFHFYFLNGE